jgi:CMP-N-acetylneuraminic acid synthetase
MGGIDELEGLKDTYRGRKAFILATGPSLAYKDMSFLKDEVTISLNLGSLMCDQWGFRPTFNIVADKYVYPQFPQVFEQLTKDTDTKKIIVASACETFPEHLRDKNTYFVPQKLPQEVVRFAKNPVEEGFWRGKTVAYDALQLAYFLGFDEVYILGMDMTAHHSWGSDGHSYELRKNPRFPDLEFPHTQTPFIQRGWPGHPEYWDLIKAYMTEARTAFEAAGRKVINDKRSAMDAFEQEDIIHKFSDNPHVVAVVPAKGTSSRVTSKNIRELDGKPLFLHILDTLTSCHAVDEVYLDTESEEVAGFAAGRNCKRIYRPTELATNATDGNQLLLFEASQIPDADIYVQALPTAPFLKRETIDNAVFALTQSPQHTSTVAVIKQKQYLWNDGKPLNYDPAHIPNSVDLKPMTIETMGLYVIRKEELFDSKTRVGRKPILYPIPLLDAFDINTEEEFQMAEALMRGLKR